MYISFILTIYSVFVRYLRKFYNNIVWFVGLYFPAVILSMLISRHYGDKFMVHAIYNGVDVDMRIVWFLKYISTDIETLHEFLGCIGKGSKLLLYMYSFGEMHYYEIDSTKNSYSITKTHINTQGSNNPNKFKFNCISFK